MTTDHLTLRDHLALDRTRLAIQRTWMAHLRTALALFVAGASFLQFFEHQALLGVGIAFIAAAPPWLVIATVRFVQGEQNLKRLVHDYGKPAESAGDSGPSSQ